MEHQAYIKIKNQMTQYDEVSGFCHIDCFTCPLFSLNNGLHLTCSTLERNHPAEAEEIVQKWAKEHPVKSRQQAMLEVFPHWDWFKNGVVDLCPANIDKNFYCREITDVHIPSDETCTLCMKKYWLGDYEEPEKGDN